MAIWRNALVLDEVPRLLGELNNEDHENCLFIVHEIVQKETLNGWNLSETLSWTIGVTKEVVERVNIGSPETLKTVPWLLGILNQFTMTGDVPLNKKIGIDLDIVSVMLCRSLRGFQSNFTAHTETCIRSLGETQAAPKEVVQGPCGERFRIYAC